MPEASAASVACSPVSRSRMKSLGSRSLASLRRGLGLVRPQPQQLGRLEAGAGAVAGDRDDALAAQPRVDLVALGMGAGVVPQECRADRIAGGVEEHRAVHLARQADAGELVRVGSRSEVAQHRERGLPPRFGLLLGPAGAWCQQRIGRGRPREHGTAGGQQDTLGTAGADVDPIVTVSRPMSLPLLPVRAARLYAAGAVLYRKRPLRQGRGPLRPRGPEPACPPPIPPATPSSIWPCPRAGWRRASCA